MKLGQALRLVLSRWDITPYRLAKTSGVGQATIGKLIKGDLESSTWDVIERLANGFEKLDIAAKVTFLGLLTTPQEKLSSYKTLRPLPELEEIEKPENIAKVLAAAEEFGIINREAVDEFFEQRLMSVERFISVRLQEMRAEESDRDA